METRKYADEIVCMRVIRLNKHVNKSNQKNRTNSEQNKNWKWTLKLRAGLIYLFEEKKNRKVNNNTEQ